MNEEGLDAHRSAQPNEQLGRLADCLNKSFAADNHASLSDEITRLLLHLSHEEPDAQILPHSSTRIPSGGAGARSDVPAGERVARSRPSSRSPVRWAARARSVFGGEVELARPDCGEEARRVRCARARFGPGDSPRHHGPPADLERGLRHDLAAKTIDRLLRLKGDKA